MSTAWFFFIVYALTTAGLALWAGRHNESASSFAIGTGRMSPIVVGITLGATIASSATFVLYPGFVYTDGLGALIGFSAPLVLGLLLGLALFSPRFQSFGAGQQALTVPHWLGARYDDLNLRRFFAGLQVLNVAYLVLIVVGCAFVMEASLHIPFRVAAVGTVLFVFGYTALGGATAHAFTNTLQGAMMLVVSLLVFTSGLHLWPEAGASLAEGGLTNPDSPLYSSELEVFAVPFLIGIALTTQPHLLSKALYVKGARDLRTTVGIGIGTYAMFALMLSAGAYARVVLPEGVATDRVVAEYLQVAFAWPAVGAAISVAILAASMSTLDGLLVAISASVGNDVFPGKGTVWTNRLVLVALAVITVGIAFDHYQRLQDGRGGSVLILGQVGVFGLVAASVGPLIAGLMTHRPLPRGPAWASALIALGIHFTLALNVFKNPGIAALAAMAVSIPVALLGLVLRRN